MEALSKNAKLLNQCKLKCLLDSVSYKKADTNNLHYGLQQLDYARTEKKKKGYVYVCVIDLEYVTKTFQAILFA